MSLFSGTYGINKPLKATTEITDDTVFLVRNFKNARDVQLVGTFEGMKNKPIKLAPTSQGWSVSIPLSPGKYFYYYQVDEKRITDPENELIEPDQKGKLRSVLFVPNFIFELDDFAQATSVRVAGNFNNWDSTALNMCRVNGVWRLPLFLNDGTYAYKFIVDGAWITDPQNPILRPDGNGNYNSYFSIGSVTVFKLYGFTDARKVQLAGNFNRWNYTELQMNKTDSGWELPYTLGQGMYEYKFVVDGEWIIDPDNPFLAHRAHGLNSLKCVDSNYLFLLSGHSDAEVVIVSGSFNKWDDTNFEMVKNGAVWEFPICLMPGEHTYFFLVDGQAICDPENPEKVVSDFGAESSLLKIPTE